MALSEQTQALLSKIDFATTSIASEIESLNGKITTAMSDADVADLNSRLTSIADKLTSIGSPSDPNVQAAATSDKTA